MIELLTYKPAFGTFSASPFCTKAAYLLNMAGVEWKRVDLNDPRKMPFGKLPAIKVGETLVPDSDNIRSYLESNGADFDAELPDLDRGTARALIRMAEEHMYFHLVLDRWADDRVWPVLVATYFEGIPKLLRGIVTSKLRKQVLQGANFQGLGRLTPAQRLERIEPDLLAITTRLWHGKFMFGNRPTAADATIVAMLGAMRAGPIETLLVRRIKQDAVLMDYIDRADEEMMRKGGQPPTA